MADHHTDRFVGVIILSALVSVLVTPSFWPLFVAGNGTMSLVQGAAMGVAFGGPVALFGLVLVLPLAAYAWRLVLRTAANRSSLRTIAMAAAPAIIVTANTLLALAIWFLGEFSTFAAALKFVAGVLLVGTPVAALAAPIFGWILFRRVQVSPCDLEAQTPHGEGEQ